MKLLYAILFTFLSIILVEAIPHPHPKPLPEPKGGKKSKSKSKGKGNGNGGNNGGGPFKKTMSKKLHTKGAIVLAQEKDWSMGFGMFARGPNNATPMKMMYKCRCHPSRLDLKFEKHCCPGGDKLAYDHGNARNPGDWAKGKYKTWTSGEKDDKGKEIMVLERTGDKNCVPCFDITKTLYNLTTGFNGKNIRQEWICNDDWKKC